MGFALRQYVECEETVHPETITASSPTLSQLGTCDKIPANDHKVTESREIQRPVTTRSKYLLSAVGDGDLECVRKWIEVGANINAKDASGKTPLILAAKVGNLALVKFLLESGADM